jgi:hypothetical protein
VPSAPELRHEHAGRHEAAVSALTFAWEAKKQHRDLIRRIQSGTGALFGLLACTIKGSPDHYFVCRLCGSTALEVPREVCPICKKAASQYRGAERDKRITTEQARCLPADSPPPKHPDLGGCPIHPPSKLDDLVKSRQTRRHSKKLSRHRRDKARVISMPSWELFESQSQEYRDSVLLTEIAARVAVEEASTFGWERYTGLQGTVLGIHTFGLSAPMKVVAQHFGFEPEHVVAAAKEQIARHASKKRARRTNSGGSGRRRTPRA